MPKTYAVVGSRGTFGSDMLKVLETSGAQVKGFNRDNLDLTDSVESLARELSGSEFIVNAVAYTKVDLAEVNQDSAQFANSEVPRKLAEACKLNGSRLIHISTDYVFDGESKSPYLPGSQTNPKSVYGVTKLTAITARQGLIALIGLGRLPSAVLSPDRLPP